MVGCPAGDFGDLDKPPSRLNGLLDIAKAAPRGSKEVRIGDRQQEDDSER